MESNFELHDREGIHCATLIIEHSRRGIFRIYRQDAGSPYKTCVCVCNSAALAFKYKRAQAKLYSMISEV